jgi:hypothetical protein
MKFKSCRLAVPGKIIQSPGVGQSGCVFTGPALREIHEPHLALIHDRSQIKAALCLADEVPQNRRTREVSDFVQHWGQCLSLQLLRHRSEPLPPVALHDGIRKLANEGLAVAGVREKAEEPQQGRSRRLEESEEGIFQDIFQAGTPEFAVAIGGLKGSVVRAERSTDNQVRYCSGSMSVTVSSNTSLNYSDRDHMPRARFFQMYVNLQQNNSLSIPFPANRPLSRFRTLVYLSA